MWNHAKIGLVSACCLVALAIGVVGCHHDHDDDTSRQSGYYQDRAGYDRHYDYDQNHGDYDRDHGDNDHRTY